MKRVRMKQHITGSRNGQEWPQAGGEIDLPDGEAADLIANGYAEPTRSVPVLATQLADMSVKALRTLAKDAGVDLPKRADKDDIVAAIAAATEEAQSDEGTAGDTGGPGTDTGGSDGAPSDPPAGNPSESGDPGDDPPADA